MSHSLCLMFQGRGLEPPTCPPSIRGSLKQALLNARISNFLLHHMSECLSLAHPSASIKADKHCSQPYSKAVANAVRCDRRKGFRITNSVKRLIASHSPEIWLGLEVWLLAVGVPRELDLSEMLNMTRLSKCFQWAKFQSMGQLQCIRRQRVLDLERAIKTIPKTGSSESSQQLKSSCTAHHAHLRVTLVLYNM